MTRPREGADLPLVGAVGAVASLLDEAAGEVGTPSVSPRASLAELVAGESRRRRRRRWLSKGLLGLLLVGLVAVAVWWWQGRGVAPAERYLTALVGRGDVVALVRATGRLEARSRVEVGSSVSGRIASVKVQFNERVRKGQVLAELDTDSLRGQLSQARARLRAARAAVSQARVEDADARRRLRLSRSLFARDVESRFNLDAAEAVALRARAGLDSAVASLGALAAAYRVARTGLSDAIIRAPIDGVIIARNVDPGQTVAALLQSPVLFVLAADLRQMHVITSVDEADIDRVRVGQQATFTVDAFPAREFSARVTQVRNAPIMVQNVITYEAILEVDNGELKLRPGMTATVRVHSAEARGVLRVPLAALRFAMPGAAPPAQPSVWLLGVEGAPALQPVSVGLSDGANAEVLLGLTEGARVVVDLTAAWRRYLGARR